MAGTSITYEQVAQAAQDIKTCASTMNDIFDNFTSTMKVIGADDVFAGTASESLTEKFATLKGRLTTYVTKVEKFSEKLKTAEEANRATEQKIQAQVEQIGDMPL